MTDLAKLVVKLEAQTAEFAKQLEKSQAQLRRFNKESSVSASNIAKGIGAAATAAAVAIGYFTKATIDNADRLNDLSKSVGASTEFLSQMEFAAKQSGIGTEELSKGLAKLSKAALSAAKDGGASAETFKQLGISVQNADGTMRGTEELLLDISDKFSKMENGVAKTGLAMELFGRSGATMIPLLNEGSAGISAMRQEADALGLTLEQGAATAADQFNDNLERLKGAASGVINQAVQQFLPTLVALTDRFVKSAKEGGGLKAAIDLLVITFKGFVSAGIIVKSVFEQLGQVIYGVGAAVVAVAQGEFKLAKDEITSAFSQAQQNATEDMELIAQVWADAVPKVAESAAQMDQALEDTVIFNPEKAGEKAAASAEKARESLAQMAAGLREQIATFGQSREAVLAYQMAHGDLAKLIQEGGPAAAQYAYEIEQLSASLWELEAAEAAQKEAVENDNRLKEEAASLTESLRTEAELYAESLRRLNELHDMGYISAETYARGLEKATTEFESTTRENTEFLEQASRNVQDIIADNLANGFEGGAKGMLDSFVNMLQQMAAQAIAAQIAEKIFGTGGVGSGGGWIGTAIEFGKNLFTGGGMASGGYVHAGVPVRVGDRGAAEWFIPQTAGRIEPELAMAGGAMNVTQNFNIQAPAGTVSRRTEQQLAAAAARGLASANRRNN
jgi:hypothetical protein